MPKVPLRDVPETMLWTLHNRAGEARREGGCIQDSKCIEIYDSIDYDYERSFGRAEPSHAIRSIAFDREIHNFIAENPNGVIVNLGEGLETQRFRVDSGDKVHWLSVDVPEAIELRERFITPDAHHRHIAKSALDRAWFEDVPGERPVIVTAQGLFMYFEKQQVGELIRDMAQCWPGMWLIFDHIPPWMSRITCSKRGAKITPHYRAPKMPWGTTHSQLSVFLKHWAGRSEGYENPFPDYIPALHPLSRRLIIRILAHTPVLRNHTPGICKIKLLGAG